MGDDKATSDAPGASLETPRDRAALRDWLREVLGVSLPDQVRAGYQSPLDYLEHAFFEGHAELPTDERESARPADTVVWASRGGGKTFRGAVATALDMVFKPGIETRILGGSKDQSARMFAHLRAIFEKPTLVALVNGKIRSGAIELVNGSKCEILAQSQASVRGTRVQKLRCDEVELFKPEVLDAAQLTTRSATITVEGNPIAVRGSVECFSTMHIPYGNMHSLIEQCRSGSRKLFKWSVIDVLERCGDVYACERCPLHPACKGRAKQIGRDASGHVRVADALAMQQRVGVAQWEAEMLCDRPSRASAVLPEFDERVHVVESVPESATAADGGWTWIAGMDFGLRTCAVLWAGVDPAGAVWVIRERITQQELLDTHASALRDGPPMIDWIGVDPAGRVRSDQTGLSSMAVLRRAGLTVRERRVRLDEGLMLLRARLRPADGSGPRLYVAASCTELCRSLASYRYPDDPSATHPLKDGPDHAVDALRYMVQNLDLHGRTRSGNYLKR